MSNMIKVTTTINRSPETVWEAFMNPDNLQHWLTGFVAAEHIKGAIGAPGSVSKLKFMERGKQMEVIETVASKSPSAKIGLSGSFPCVGRKK